MQTALHKINQPYRSITEFQAINRLTWPKDEVWRLTPYAFIGEINGIPNSRGQLVATNGILCYVEQRNSTGEPMHFLGHIEWFIPDDVEVVVKRDIVDKAGTTPSQREVKLNQRVAALLEEYA